MNVKSKFTNEEWQLIANGPEWVFTALAAADGNVAIATKAKESKAFKNVVENYSASSQLVQEVLKDKALLSHEIKEATLSDAVQALEEISELLDDKLTSSEAKQYRKFLRSIADSVAEAAGEGILGIGKKISKNEKNALKKVKTALKPAKVAEPEAKPTPKPRKEPVAKPKKKLETKPEKKPEPKQEVKPKPIVKPPKPKPISIPKAPAAPSSTPPAPAEPQAPPPEIVKEPEYIAEHTVVSGETLSHISLKYYGSAVKAKYMIIYEANKDVIGDNPNIIIPGQVFKIPKLEE
jgi:hypothetical protein